MVNFNLPKGLVFTNDNCVGCNKCISVCSCMGATVAHSTEEGNNVILVDGDKCIACGKCSELMRAGTVSGCVIRDGETYMPYYREFVKKG